MLQVGIQYSMRDLFVTSSINILKLRYGENKCMMKS